MSADIRSLASRWFEEVWNRRREATINELTTPDALGYVEGIDTAITMEEWKQYWRAWLNAMPDLRFEIEYVAAEDMRAVVSWRVKGTHTGPGLGIPPSGRPVDFSGLTAFEIKDGLIVKGVDRWNRGEMIASLMQVRMDELRDHSRLTPREAQVALLMAERFGHGEIAEQLRIKPNTARRHCERVLQKLGIRRRQDVAQALGKIPGSVLDRHGSDLSDMEVRAHVSRGSASAVAGGPRR